MTILKPNLAGNSTYDFEGIPSLHGQQNTLASMPIELERGAPGTTSLTDSNIKAAVKRVVRDYGNTLRKLASE